MEFGWAKDEINYRSDLRAFLAEWAPKDWWNHPMRRHAGSTEFEEDQCRRIVTELAARGWLVPNWPSEYGGGDANEWHHLILTEEMARIGEVRGPAYMNANWIGPAIIAAGTEQQKAYHLPRMRAGDVYWCQGFSEPDAGSDLTSLRTTAIRDGDDYVVNGSKVWVSHTQMADFCFLLVRTNPATADKSGISVLLVPTDTPGFTIRPIPNFAETVGWGELFFTDMRVPVSCRLGPENEGWSVVRDALKNERLGADLVARAAFTLECLARWARSNGRLTSGDFAAGFGHAFASCQVAFLMTYKVIDALARGANQNYAEAYAARVCAVRAERDVAELAFRVMGIEAVGHRSIAEAIFRDSLISGFGAGAYEIQLNLIARQLLKLPRS